MHADYQIRWKNFRGFRDTGWVTIRPLTILIGPNNSGKTSFLAPLLILSQTLSSRDVVTPLVTRGSLIDVGAYKDLVFKHKKANDLFFGIRFHVHAPPKKRLRKVGAYPPGGIELTFSAGNSSEEIQLTGFEVCDIYKRKYFGRKRLKGGAFSTRGFPFSGMRPEERRASRRAKPANFLFTPTSVLNEFEMPTDPDKARRTKSLSNPFTLYLQVTAVVYAEIRSLLNELSYVGPIRQRPMRFYETSAETPRFVGSRGEYAANILRRRQQVLGSKLNRWVRVFEFGNAVGLKRISDELFSVEFDNGRGKPRTNIADAGFGASQVLPLIVQALAAKTDTLTIAEQPEIHLNPRLQCALADLFVEMASTKHRVIIETHSEHLLLRLRRLVADKKISNNDVALYFVERQGAESIIRNVPIKANGHIPTQSWPRGFFEDTLRESLALASAQYR